MKANKLLSKGARGTKTAPAYYGFGEASGSEFGATIQMDGQMRLLKRSGQIGEN
jgi:hypothetical protein